MTYWSYMLKLIDAYIQDHSRAWEPTTQKSERHRLYGVASALDGNPETLWASLANQHPHSRLKTFSRVIHFWDWLISNNQKRSNEYRKWKKRNALQFKNVYIKKSPEISFAEAKGLVGQIKNDSVRRYAMALLSGGLRVSEGASVHNGEVTGKGRKTRTVFTDGAKLETSYATLVRHLAKVGLKPHDLRKIFATELVKRGADGFELCELMGWSNLQTASSYIKANRNRCRELVAAVTGVAKDGSEHGDSTE